MRLICVNNIDDGHLTYLTIGKEYKCLQIVNYENRYTIINDNHEVFWYSRKLFISLEEYRDKKLEDIGI
ncbi:MAG: hypothetical protein PHY08_12770 [Candidatus Cloacimonetes bacterium]|nr:hypothetical protein [Candidatus Cloacimonadota bacterium]